MATTLCKSRYLLNLKSSYPLRFMANHVQIKTSKFYYKTGMLIFGSSLAWYLCNQSNKKEKSFGLVFAKEKKEDKEVNGEKVIPLTHREKRFIRFASIECDDQLYMTPQDFLDSVTKEDPRPRLHRSQSSKPEIAELVKYTPPRSAGSNNLFRSLRDQGIISYTEYLFLLSVLTKPYSGFRIAFNMFDTDGNQKVDKKEFLVILILQCLSRAERDVPNEATKIMREMVQDWKIKQLHQKPLCKRPTFHEQLEGIFSRHKTENSTQGDDVTLKQTILDHEQEILGLPDTTLLLHLFGQKGNDTLSYEDFHRFMDNLQAEVLELEFNEFSKGMPTISEVDFAKILLRYTHVHSDDYSEYLERLIKRIPEEKGITFKEFKQFCQFLNNLDDFAIAMRMYTFADLPISQGEFQRAVKISTGCNLGTHIVNTVFQIFDDDGDGHLSHKEFIAIMRDRLHRGFRSHLVKNEGWESFKSCVKQEMKNA